MQSGNKKIYSHKTELVDAVAEWTVLTIAQATAASSQCYIALAGGSTPKDIYARLAIGFADKVDWHKVHFFWGDERMVPPEHADSNYGMARQALLDNIAVPPENVHRIRGELQPEEAAKDCENEVVATLKDVPPRFDLILLGIGRDGHTASLFPGTTVIDEKERFVAPVFVEKLGAWRVSFTLPLINAAKQIAYLVSGQGKAEIVQTLGQLVQPEAQYPASLVQPHTGDVTWFLDSAAAARLGS